MNNILYSVLDENYNVVARDMDLEDALIFVEALFNKYFQQKKISYTLQRQDPEEG